MGRQNSACEEKRIQFKEGCIQSYNSRLNLIHGHFERLEAIEKKLTKDEIRSELATLIKRKEKVSKTDKNAGLFDHYDEFVKDGITNKRWAQNTSKKWTTVRHHLKEFNEDLKYEDITDKTLSAYVLYCARDLGREQDRTGSKGHCLRDA